MNRKEFLSMQSISLDDSIDELRRARAANPLFDKEICKYKKLLEEDNTIDKSYKMLMRLVYMDKSFEPQREMPLNSNKECDLQPRRMLKRTMGLDARPSNRMPAVDKKRKGDQQHNSLKMKKCPTRRILMDGVKVENMKDCSPSIDSVSFPERFNLYDPLASFPEFIDLDEDHDDYWYKGDTVANGKRKVENMKDYSIADFVSYPEHNNLYDNLASYPEFIDLEDDHDGYMHKGDTVANAEKKYGANDVKKEQQDAGDSDLEILDGEAIEGGILSTFVPSRRVHNDMEDDNDRAREAEFRKQVLDILKKPFDKEEYISHQNAAKGYLDHHQDLKRKLAKYKGKQGKRLTIYRGFFFWLQNLTQEGSFKPWNDRECLAVEPGYL